MAKSQFPGVNRCMHEVAIQDNLYTVLYYSCQYFFFLIKEVGAEFMAQKYY